jgi:hypothetical protein
MLYLLIICHDDAFFPSEGLVAEIHAWDRDMERRGVRRDGRPLRPPSDAVTVRVRGGSVIRTDGPFSDAPDQIAAYELVDCANLDAAVDLAATHPMAQAGTIEVRPAWEELDVEKGTP